jgi:L-ascorbate metabolism protein UlaG (beta-lactamase superfamily)
MLNRRAAVLGLASLPLAATLRPASAAGTPDVLATSAGDLTIRPVEHAGLVLSFGAEALYFDPTGGAALFEGLPPPTAILITHGHGDHFDVATLNAIAGDSAPILTSAEVFGRLPAALKARATALPNGATGEIAGLPVEVVAAYNTTENRKRYHPQGVGNGYVIGFGDKRVYVAGDTEDTPEMRALVGIDLAFLPMALPYTMSAEQLADAVLAFKPAVVYPYHYQGGKRDKLVELIGDAAELRLAEWYPA